jgi:hypothetical protein
MISITEVEIASLVRPEKYGKRRAVIRAQRLVEAYRPPSFRRLRQRAY